ncbi:MAG: GAF domain-containing protein [Ornithinimicrobium sp.]
MVASPRTDPQPVQDRMRLLMSEVHDLSGVEDGDLSAVLQRTVDLARAVTGARYGALGVLAEHDPNHLSHFITSGMSASERDRIGEAPRGLGVLGRVIRDPVGLRLDDLTLEPDSVGFPPGHPVMRTFIGMPIRTGPHVFGNLYLTEKVEGVPFDAQDQLALEALASLAGVVIDVTRQRLEADLRKTTVEGLREINRLLLSEDDPTRALSLVTEQAVRVTGADTALIVAPGSGDPSPRRVLAMTQSGEESQRAQVDRILAELGDEIEQVTSTQIGFHGAELTTTSLLQGQRGPRHTSTVPVRLREGDVVVLVVVGWRAVAAVSPRVTEDFVESLAEEVGLVLDRVSAAANHDALMKVGDRERIAHDLHDLVIQRIFAAGLTLQGAARLRPEPAVLERIERTIGELDATIHDIRATIFALTPVNAGTSIGAQVRELVASYAQNLGFTPTVRFTGPVDEAVDVDRGVALLMVLREGLSNVARHAQATAATIEVQIEGERLVITVTDNGVGLPDQVHESGLRNVRTRALERGGALELLTHTPGGTVLRWQVPLR